VKSAVLEACDDLDGLADGVVGAFARCTTTRVQPRLKQRQCKAGKQADCLSVAQTAALVRVMNGARDAHGKPLYSDWAWDAGIATPGWRIWKIGGPNGQPPALNVVLGGGSLASVFTTPPTALPSNPEALLQFLLHFDVDRDAPKINATNAEFPSSAWTDISARSPNLDGLRQRHGKLLVYHGVADPVFSINDTIAWWREVDRRYRGQAAEFTRLFPVPGMTHCGGGDTTDRFDALAELMHWVEQGRAPERIVATAGAQAPWPGRTRPLCAYPKVARYDGKGDRDKAESFVCK
jgi:Tannase and feruloyl esterase